MLIVMKKGSTREDLARVAGLVEGMGLTPHVLQGSAQTIVEVTGQTAPLDPGSFESLPGVARAVPVGGAFPLAARQSPAHETRIALGGRTIGGGGVFVMAGPCAVESEEQLLRTAHRVKEAGADALRGGAFKPRSSPYHFQGLGLEGLRILARAREETGLPIVTEAVGEASLELVAEHADVVQIGARNMRNYEMLKRAGRLKKPIFLKRGMSATLEELLMAAEYILASGNQQVGGMQRVMHKHFGAVHHSVVAFGFDCGAHAIGSPSVLRFGQRQGKYALAAGDARQPRFLYFFARGFKQYARTEHSRGEQRAGHRARAELLE